MTAPATPPAERPPYLGLEEALAAITAIQEQGGGSVTAETLSPIIGNSTKSSSFQRKVSALRGYGLVDVVGDRISVSRLGLGYVAPTSEEEKAEVAATALRNIPLARALHDRYGGGLLPNRDILANMMLREYGAAEPNNTLWADFFLGALRTAGLLAHAGGRATVLTRPNVGRADAATSSAAADSFAVNPAPTAAPTPAARAPAPMVSGEVQRIDLPLADGKVATIVLPTSATPDDIEDVIAMLTVMKTRADRAARQLNKVLGVDT